MVNAQKILGINKLYENLAGERPEEYQIGRQQRRKEDIGKMYMSKTLEKRLSENGMQTMVAD